MKFIRCEGADRLSPLVRDNSQTDGRNGLSGKKSTSGAHGLTVFGTELTGVGMGDWFCLGGTIDCFDAGIWRRFAHRLR